MSVGQKLCKDYRMHDVYASTAQGEYPNWVGIKMSFSQCSCQLLLLKAKQLVQGEESPDATARTCSCTAARKVILRVVANAAHLPKLRHALAGSVAEPASDSRTRVAGAKACCSLCSARSVQRTTLTKSMTAPQHDSPAQPLTSWAQVHAHAACAPVLRCDSQ